MKMEKKLMKNIQAAIINKLQELASEERAELNKRYFKTGPGDYGEDDIFWGISNPHLKQIAKEYQQIVGLDDIIYLLKNKVHEIRLLALFLLVAHYEKELSPPKEIVDIYLKNTRYINNWDLVDLSAYKILGHWCYHYSSSPLEELIDSKDLWEIRIAIVSTYFFIKKGDFRLTFDFALKQIKHPHDLIHKAIGWMLREVGKMEFDALTDWLKLYYKELPRTSLRYAIERFPESLRQAYLKGTI